MPAFGRGFLFAALGPRGCAPLGTPAGGAPCTACLTSASGGLPGPLAEGRGAGKSAPDTLPAGLGRSGRVKGPCPRPYGAAGHTNPLTRPSLEKRARGPRRAWRGTAGVDGGQGSRSDRAAAAHDAQERPHAPGWWLGCFSPAACHVANAPEAAGERS